MQVILIKILPLILIFLLGYSLKRLGILKKENGDVLLRLIFYLAAPALILVSLQEVDLDKQYFFLPLIAIIIVLSLYGLATLVAKSFKLPRKTLGTFLVGSAIINTGFTFPFLFSVHREEAVIITSFFDLGNALIVFSFVYYVACKYGDKGSSPSYALKRIFAAPPLWAIVVGLSLNWANIPLGSFLDNLLTTLGNLLIPLTMLALGIYFSLKIERPKLLLTVITLRMGLGLVIGVILTKIFGLSGLTQALVIMLAASPVGYNTITFSSLENLDTEFAASAVSLSIVLGIILIPVLLVVLS